MEPLLRQLRDLPKKLLGLSFAARLGLLFGGAALVGVAVLASMVAGGGTYQYAFTNLSPEDAGEAATQLKTAGIPHRLEAGGTALAVPASHVYDARLLLAAAGLPRGGGVGFEIFDKGDLGVSEFTQRINLRRATEGELGRTIGKLAAVKAARVHITLPEKGLYRDEDRKAAAAVVVNLQAGRVLADRELAGIRHLVASAVPGLDPEAVTIVDGRGGVLAGQTSQAGKASEQTQELERGLEGRIVDLLEKAVGQGAVVAKVTASMDTSDVESTQDAYDPEAMAVRSERRTAELTGGEAGAPNGVAGAAANQPLQNAGGVGTTLGRGGSQREDEIKNYEISKTITRTVTRGPRLKRLSVAVLVDGIDGKARPAAEVARLAELAKSAVGFDAARGDKFEISSAPFSAPAEAAMGGPEPVWALPIVKYGAPALLGILVIGGVLVVLLLRGRKRRAEVTNEAALLQPGTRVSELEALMEAEQKKELGAIPGATAGALPGAEPEKVFHDPNVVVRDRARKLAGENPERAALLIKAWIQSDFETQEAAQGG